jgi:hypothetical protein
MTMRLALLLALSALVACAAPLSRARMRVAAVRPGVDLADVRTASWNQFPPSRVASGELLSTSYARTLIAAHSETLAAIGVLSVEESERILQRFSGDLAGWMAAFVIPSRALVVVRPTSARNVHILTHEIAHLASYRRGYWSAAEAELSLRADRPRDPAWIDLDAFLGTWAVEEGIAEVTALAADEHERAGAVDLAALARAAPRAPLFTDTVQLQGPGRIVFNERVYELAEGEVVDVVPDVHELLLELAYAGGVAYVLAQPLEATLEQHFQAAWNRFGRTTLEILQPERAARSMLAAAFRSRRLEIQPEPTATTRIGALLALHVATSGRIPLGAARDLVSGLLDDLVPGLFVKMSQDQNGSP